MKPWPRIQPLDDGYELKIGRVYNYDIASNTVHCRLIEKFNIKSYTLGGVSRSAPCHTYNGYAYYVNLRMTTDEYYLNRLKMGYFDKLYDERDQSINAWTMFLPNFISEGIYNPIYLYVMVPKKDINTGALPNIGIACFRANDIPIEDAPALGTCGRIQHSQRLFPTYKIYLKIPEWESESNTVTNHYWDVEKSRIVCSIPAISDTTLPMIVGQSDSRLYDMRYGIPADTLAYSAYGDDKENMFYKQSAMAEDEYFSRYIVGYPEDDGRKYYMIFDSVDGMSYHHYDSYAAPGGDIENNENEIFLGGSATYREVVGDAGLMKYLDPRAAPANEAVSVGFFINSWPVTDPDIDTVTQPSYSGLNGLVSYYVGGRTVHDGHGNILDDESQYVVKAFDTDRAEDPVLSLFINDIARKNETINGDIRWKIHDMTLILKPYGQNGAMFGDKYDYDIDGGGMRI